MACEKNTILTKYFITFYSFLEIIFQQKKDETKLKINFVSSSKYE